MAAITIEPQHKCAGRGAESGPRCLLCGLGPVELFLDLGRTALANQFTLPGQPAAPEYPLRAGQCAECGHVQLLDRVPPEAMFRDYLYVSSASSTLTAHLGRLASAIVSRARLNCEDGLVVDIGSNDGTLLAAFGRLGARRRRGVDPAANLAALARSKGVETDVAFFTRATAERLAASLGPARVITATNSFPHIPDLDGYLAGIQALLAADGMFVVEAHYLADLVEQVAFDTIYHEHVSYWALGPMRRLLDRFGLEVFDVERLPLHHGQLRAWIGWRGRRAVSPAVEELAQQERQLGLDRRDTFVRFARRASAIGESMRATLGQMKRSGVRVAGYGAPAKASTLLAWCGLGPELVEFIADRSPLKQGRLTPGTGIPIVDPGEIERRRPDVLILFAWNFAEEVMEQLEPYRKAGGRFLIPVPDVRIV
jgi:hypothetical protein